METHLEKKEKTDLKKQDRKEIDIINPMSFFSPFLSFKYSYRSIYSDGEKTHIKAKENRFENGHFESAEFEGTMDQSVNNQMVKEMHSYFKKQLDFFIRPFSFFQPRLKKD